MSQWPASDRNASTLRLFLGQAGIDQGQARAVTEALEAVPGIELSREVTGPACGDDRSQALEDVLRGCDVFLLLIGSGEIHDRVLIETSRALDCRFEARKGRRRPLILPLLLPGVEQAALPPFLRLFPVEIWPIGCTLDQASEVLAHQILPRLRDRLARGAVKPMLPSVDDDRASPFRGLEPYGADDTRLFLGRQRDTAELLIRLGRAEGGRRRRWLQIEGESGCGKTSLVRAGLLPAIERGWRGFGRQGCMVLPPMRPLDDALHALATLLHVAFSGLLTVEDLEQRLTVTGEHTLADLLTALRLYKTDRGRESPVLLLVIDQFEELLTIQDDPRRTQLFDRLLANALQDESAGLHLITVVRSDLLDFHTLPALQQCLNARGTRYQLGRFDEEQMRELVFDLPVASGVVWSDPELPGEILDRVLKAAAPLPTLQLILGALWAQRENGCLTRRYYARRYGRSSEVPGAAADHALRAAGDRDGALDLLLELAVERGDEGFARRPLRYPEAVGVAGGGRRGERIVRRLAGREGTGDELPLLTVSADEQGYPRRVELIHEVLLREGVWSTLRKHLETNRGRHRPHRLHGRGSVRWWNRLAPHGIRQRIRRVAVDDSQFARYLRRSQRTRRLLKALMVMLVPVLMILVDTGYGLDRRDRDGWAALSMTAVWERIRYRGVWLHHQLRLWRGDFPVPALVSIPPGVFLMGSSTSLWENERPVREVVIDYGFRLGRYEITFEEYDFFANATDRSLPDDADWGRGRRPVINVNWREAVAYGRWLSDRTGQSCRLATEAEWEYAARAGGTGDYGLGRDGRAITVDTLGDYAWYAENADRQTRAVGTRLSNARGLHDMHGNVWEWVQDCWHDDYRNAPRDGSAWEAADGGDCGRRVLRGGAWFYNANDLRAAARNWSPPEARGTFIGFRLACLPAPGGDG